MVYAIGMKGWVELREADAPPKPKTTRSSRVVTTSGRHFNYDTGAVTTKKIKKKVQIVTTVWEGGKLLATIPAMQYCRVVGVSLLPKQLKKLTDLQATKLMGASWKQMTDGDPT